MGAADDSNHEYLAQLQLAVGSQRFRCRIVLVSGLRCAERDLSDAVIASIHYELIKPR